MDANKMAARVAMKTLNPSVAADVKVKKRQQGASPIIAKLIDATGGDLSKMLTIVVMAAQESGKIEGGDVQKLVSKLQQAVKSIS